MIYGAILRMWILGAFSKGFFKFENSFAENVVIYGGKNMKMVAIVCSKGDGGMRV